MESLLMEWRVIMIVYNYKNYLMMIYSLRTILAVAGEDFAVIASDTRLSEGFQIYTRDSPKTYKMYGISIMSSYNCNLK